jgi:hypothetical protein
MFMEVHRTSQAKGRTMRGIGENTGDRNNRRDRSVHGGQEPPPLHGRGAQGHQQSGQECVWGGRKRQRLQQSGLDCTVHGEETSTERAGMLPEAGPSTEGAGVCVGRQERRPQQGQECVWGAGASMDRDRGHVPRRPGTCEWGARRGVERGDREKP